MKRNKINIKDLALEQLIREAIITPKKERRGLVFGYIKTKREKNIYVVEIVHPQDGERKRDKIEIDEKVDERTYWSTITESLGDYHSHVRFIENGKIEKGRVALSSEDYNYLRDYPYSISIILGIDPIKNPCRLKIDELKISGAIELDKKYFKIEIGGYYNNGGKRRAKLEIPKKTLKSIF